MQELFTFAFHQLCNRNTGPSADDTGNLFFCDFIPEQRVLVFLLFFCNGLLFFQLLFQLRQTTVFQFSSFVQIIVTFCTFDLCIDLFQLFPQFLYFGNRIFFIFPFGFHFVELVTHLRQFLLYIFQMRLGEFVILFL